MRRKLLLSVFAILFICIIINIDTKSALAATHTHTDTCYAGHRHARSGCYQVEKIDLRVANNETSTSGTFHLIFYSSQTGYQLLDILVNYNWGMYGGGAIHQAYVNNTFTNWNSNGTPKGTITQFYGNISGSLADQYVGFCWSMARLTSGYSGGYMYANNLTFNMNSAIVLPATGAGYIVNYDINSIPNAASLTTWSCGLVQDETPICPAYIVAPSVNLYKLASSTIITEANTSPQNTILTETNTSVYPQITIYDNENDNLDCKYYIDGSTTATGSMSVTGSYPAKVVAFTTPFSTVGLSEGSHTIKVTASDNYAKYIGETTLTFYVDKLAPTISPTPPVLTVTSLNLSASATDTVSGLHATAYRFTLGTSAPTDWLSRNYNTFDNLPANTYYTYKIEVRDKTGHIASQDGSCSTLVDKPVVTATALSENKIQIVVKDTNPTTTNYRINVGSGYANAVGSIVGTETWITMPYDSAAGGKLLVVSGLASNTIISITVSSKNTATGAISVGSSVSAVTSPAIPAGFACALKTYDSIKLSWSSVVGAASYRLYRETLAADGSIIANDTFDNITLLTSENTGLMANNNYRYKIRAKNSVGLFGCWSEPITIKTYPTPSAKVTGVTSTVDGKTLNITWNAITGVIGYKIFINIDGVNYEYSSTTNQKTVDTGKYDCQCNVTVQAFNVCNGSDQTVVANWCNGGAVSAVGIFNTKANIPTILPVAQNTITPTSLTVQWQANGNPASVKYKLGVFKDNVLIQEIDCSNTLEDNVTGLLPKTSYTFKVKAINSKQVETEWTSAVSATTLIDYPGIPGGLTANTYANQIVLSWPETANAQSYQVSRDEIVIATVPAVPGNTKVTYKDLAVVPETKYTYKVQAVNTTGSSGWSQTLTLRSKGNLPETPTIADVIVSSVSISISWTTVSGATGYDIMVDGKVYNIGLDTSYMDDGLVPGSQHTYSVRARNNFGNSAWSATYSKQTTPNIPDIPGSVIVQPSDTQFLISWGAVEGADCYEVEIDGIIYRNIIGTQYLYTFQEPVAGLEHSVRVRSVNSSGEGEWSEAFKSVLLDKGEGTLPVIPVPASPTAICSVSGSSIITVSWEAVEGATVYQVEADNTVIYTGSETAFTHVGLEASSQHQYRVSAGNISGSSEWSNPITAVTDALITTTPQNISFYRDGDSHMIITWGSVSGAVGYKIEINGVVSNDTINDSKVSINTVPGEQYDIRVASIIQNGTEVQLEWSGVVTFRTLSNLPNTPIVDKITATSNTITVNWNAVTGANGYEIDVDGQIVDVHNNLSYSINNLLPSSTHKVKIRAYNEAGMGKWSENSTIMTNGSAPGVPVNIIGKPATAVEAATGSAISITWDNLNGATSYEVECSNGITYPTTQNEITIQNLIPGVDYTFRVRALSSAGEGEWSSRISVIPVVAKPGNVTVVTTDGTARISWDKVGGANSYEVEIDGVIVASTGGTSINLNYETFYKQRTVRIRACYGTQKGEWSNKVLSGQSLAVKTNLYENEEISILLPASDAEIGQYRLTLTYNTDELELLDAYGITPDKEITSTYIESFDTYVIIEKSGTIVSITFIIQPGENMYWTGIVGNILFRSKISGTVTLYYGVTEK